MAKSPCAVRDCSYTVPRGERFCTDHRFREMGRQYKEDIKRRGSASERGYDSRWAKVRAAYLRKHPLCECGCDKPADLVDHIIPISGPDDPLLWDEENFQSLTTQCHTRKHKKNADISTKNIVP